MTRSMVMVTALLMSACSAQPHYDAIIRGGRVVDGTGRPRSRPISASSATASRPWATFGEHGRPR